MPSRCSFPRALTDRSTPEVSFSILSLHPTPMSWMGAEDFPGNGRFRLLAKLGAGSMGVVYRAYDQQQGREIALKTLQRFGATSLYRFKREFRALADVAHPNLVSLYELLCERNTWFFTMELLDGVSFGAWVSRA